jgi:ribosomal protein S18 acetylase RimI-like enzyme
LVVDPSDPSDPSDPVTVRPATAADTAAVATVWGAAWHDGHRGHVPQELIEGRGAAYFVARADELLAQTAVAVGDSGVLGVLILREDEVNQLMVSAAARGRGVGALLLEDAERRVAAAGHDEVWLAVVPGNTTARGFYEARGWTDRGRETYDSVTLGGGTVPVEVCRYAKRLR